MKQLLVTPKLLNNYYYCPFCKLDWEEVWESSNIYSPCNKCKQLLLPYRSTYKDAETKEA